MFFPCSDCGAKLKGGPALAGKKVKCPQCNGVVTVPETAPADARKAGPSGARPWLLGLLVLAPVGLVIILCCVRYFKPAGSLPVVPPPTLAPTVSFLEIALGNQSVPGVEDAGFYGDEQNDEGPFRWTDGNAKLEIPLDPRDLPQALHVQLMRPKTTSLQITVNGQEFINEKAIDRSLHLWERKLDLRGIDLGDKLVVQIACSTIVPQVVAPGQSEDSRPLGVRVGLVKLLRHAGPEVTAPGPPSFVDVVLGNRFVDGVEDEGFHQDERDREAAFRWTKGKGKLVIPLDKKALPKALRVQLGLPMGRSLQIKVNGRELLKKAAGEPAPWMWDRTLDLEGIDLGESLVLELVSSTSIPKAVDPTRHTDDRIIGVQVRGIKLLRDRGEPKKPVAVPPRQ